MAKKKGWNLKKGSFDGDYGRQRAHSSKIMREFRGTRAKSGIPYRGRAEYGSRKGIKKYKPRDV